MKKFVTFSHVLNVNGFRTYGNFTVKKIEDYIVAVKPTGVNNQYEISFDIKEQDISKDVLKQIKRDLKAKYGKTTTITTRGKLFQIYYYFNDKKEDDFINLVNETISYLRRNYISARRECAICGMGQCDSLGCVNNNINVIHEDCIKRDVQKKVEDINKKKKSLLLGTIGAILGMIVGVIPTITTILINETIYSYLVFLIPLAIFYGYKLLNGKLGNYSLIITILLSLFSVIFMQFVLCVIVLTNEWGYSFKFAFDITWQSFSDLEILVDIIKECVVEYIFVGISLFVVWSLISKTENTLKEEVVESLSILTSLDNLDSENKDSAEF